MKVIVVTPGVTVPAAAIRMSVSRSSGPGGQNVNKVASKVELRVDLSAVVGLTPAARGRLDLLVQSRTDAEGNLLVTSQLTRDQPRNLEDAREKVRTLVARALVKPIPRRPTRPSRAAKERRLVGKRHQSERKRGRDRRAGDE
jgi:ribosome-associated protein